MSGRGFKQTQVRDEIVYGPVPSRRFGPSLGINILPAGRKVCTFNCRYCQLGWSVEPVDALAVSQHRWPGPREIAREVREALADLQSRGEPLNQATLSGNGEPTLHPMFLEVCRELVGTRDKVWPGLPLVVLTNATRLHVPDVMNGLNLLDERVVKFDAALPATYRTVNGPLTDVAPSDVLDGIRRLKDCVVQSLFITGRNGNAGDADVDAWIEAVGTIKPKSVQLYTLSRVPADTRLEPVSRQDLKAIADLLQERTGLAGEVF